ncbi:WD40-repeat-containing domain protein [Yarrowia lipolytica]|uniref:WD40-repeat-containing domain protein n=1 Tax=Yarrowia lipolytica TaxID=4952 RepID=A0A371BZR6_YARLL|nr:WD40-repeat-containing domain protein [Yarrowia lipolytica]RDW30501.1 WD40-repeat-containing domain protein [Yarrowia lipolytica]RDW37158.1 WD40-repeat-containing domain protein [Yarrowia lipolytica]RDW43623.1 WD40-repeat-containing domain protein [Yarrowia lipolytica]RDW50452.1 WD40-repeat-containing domain protein [Yarrowia lipolytica]
MTRSRRPRPSYVMEGDDFAGDDSDSDFNPGIEPTVEDDDMDVDVNEVKAEEEDGNYGDEMEVDYVPSKSSKSKTKAVKPTLKNTPRKMPVKKIPTTKAAAANKENGEDRKVALKDRFNLFYGFDEASRVKGNAIRQTWGNVTYAWGKNIMTPNVTFETPPDLKVNVAEQFGTAEKGDDLTTLGPSMSLLNSTGEETTLAPKTSSSWKASGGDQDAPNPASVINAGAPVSSVAWAYGHTVAQYLAVSTLNSSLSDSTTGLPESTDPTFKAFACNTGPGTIQIWKFSPQPSLNQVFTFDFGFASEMAFQPRNQDDARDSVGLLASVFQDGSVRVFEVPYNNNDEPVHMTLKAPYRTFMLASSKATCLCWRGPTVIVVGYTDGKIAEFDISDTDDETALIPSYFLPIHSTYVASIACGYPVDSHLVFSSSPDGFCKLTDVSDARHTRAINLRVIDYTPAVAYQSHVSSFTCLEDSETVRVLPTRQLNLYKSLTSVTRHQTHAMSVGTSINHPFVISGGSDGTVAMGNCVRRVMVGARYTHSYAFTILWRFEYSKKENKYRLFDGLRSDGFVKATNSKNRVTFPENVTVTSVQWNNNAATGGWYAAGLTSGLVRVDCVV